MITLAGFALLLVVLIASGVFLFTKSYYRYVVPGILFPAGCLFIGEFIGRTILMGYPAFVSLYDALIIFTILLIAVNIAASLYGRLPARRMFTFVLLFITVVLVALASSGLFRGDIRPPVPALRSLWLVVHVLFAFIGEAGLTAALVFAVLYLVFSKKNIAPGLYRLMNLSAVTGYMFFTAGALVFGAVWAHETWGRYWGWDPKETWALVTWLILTLYMHMRFFNKKHPKLAAALVILAWCAAMFTLFGVTFVLGGEHTYN